MVCNVTGSNHWNTCFVSIILFTSTNKSNLYTFCDFLNSCFITEFSRIHHLFKSRLHHHLQFLQHFPAHLNPLRHLVKCIGNALLCRKVRKIKRQSINMFVANVIYICTGCQFRNFFFDKPDFERNIGSSQYLLHVVV